VEEKPESLLNQHPERRAQPRYAVDDPATLLLLNSGSNAPCSILELSLEGCRLRVGREFRVGSLARVELTFQVHRIAFRLSGVSKWSDGKQTVGIRFAEMTSRRSEDLAELLAEIESELAAKKAQAAAEKLQAEKAEAEKLIAKKLAEERQSAERQEREKLNQEKLIKEELDQEKRMRERLAASKLVLEKAASLKLNEKSAAVRVETIAARIDPPQAQRPPLASESAGSNVTVELPQRTEGQHRPAGTTPPSPPSKRERREQTRHSVDTNATIFLVDVASRAPGQILDVSLGGCKIHTIERFPVGIYRRVEVEFVLDGLPFRLGGVTQSLHDKHTVGVRFLDLSERKREHLTQVIEEIDQMREDHPRSETSVGPIP
jgi:hypothetical protein